MFPWCAQPLKSFVSCVAFSFFSSPANDDKLFNNKEMVDILLPIKGCPGHHVTVFLTCSCGALFGLNTTRMPVRFVTVSLFLCQWYSKQTWTRGQHENINATKETKCYTLGNNWLYKLIRYFIRWFHQTDCTCSAICAQKLKNRWKEFKYIYIYDIL